MKIIILILGLFFFNSAFSQNVFTRVSNKSELNNAKEKAEADGKMLYMIITADWCSTCRTLKAELVDLAKEDYFKENIMLAITDYDKFGDSDLVWEIFSSSASWSAPTNLFFVKGKEYPTLIKGYMNKSKITSKVKALNK